MRIFNRAIPMVPAIRLIVVVLGLAGLAGCQSMERAQVQYDSGADYSEVSTFTWITSRPLAFHRIDPAADVNPMLESSLKRHTRDFLTRKGFRYVDNLDEADLAISFSVGARTWRPTIRNRYPVAVSEDERDAWVGYWLDATIDDLDYLEGQVCVDVHDTSTRQTIWHGTVRDIRLESEAVFDDATVKTIVGKIIDEFPPQR